MNDDWQWRSVVMARNVHEALPKAAQLLKQAGAVRPSRNGPVRVAPWPVTTCYTNPAERVVFWPQRDANPFLHLYESLWILAGRCDVEPLARYAKQFREYSDDGETFHAAYGYRWRREFGDQLAWIARRLMHDPDDRRCVLQTWAAPLDLGVESKDIPCNVMLTFQRGRDGKLDVVVFQRSADILWGTYGANAVQMSVLQEYVAAWIGCPVGTLTQVSVNWHAYETAWPQIEALAAEAEPVIYAIPAPITNPYADGLVRPVPLVAGEVEQFDKERAYVLAQADAGFSAQRDRELEPFLAMAYVVLKAHQQWRTLAAPERFDRALAELADAPQDADWVVAAREWLVRRRGCWERRMVNAGGRGHASSL